MPPLYEIGWLRSVKAFGNGHESLQPINIDALASVSCVSVEDIWIKANVTDLGRKPSVAARYAVRYEKIDSCQRFVDYGCR